MEISSSRFGRNQIQIFAWRVLSVSDIFSDDPVAVRKKNTREPYNELS